MKRIICFILALSLLMFAGCRKNVETPKSDNEPTATALTTATPTASAGETEPDVFPDAEETPGNGATVKPDNAPDTTAKSTDAPNTTATAGGEKTTDTSSKTAESSITPTPNGGVEMPRVPLG